MKTLLSTNNVTTEVESEKYALEYYFIYVFDQHAIVYILDPSSLSLMFPEFAKISSRESTSNFLYLCMESIMLYFEVSSKTYMNDN